MAANLVKNHIQTIKFSPPLSHFKFPWHNSYSLLPFSKYPKHLSITTLLQNKPLPLDTPKVQLLSIHSSLSSSPTPPITKEDAVLQIKTSLSTALQKPLNNPRLTGRIKKQKQARFRVEVPVLDDTPESFTQLVFEIFGNIQIKRKGSTVKILLIWPNPSTLSIGINAFQGVPSNGIEHVELTTIMTVDNRILNSADVAVFLAPNSSQLAVMKLVSESLYSTPLVLFNPKWTLEEEGSFGDSSKFVASFEVIYALLVLEVRGLLSRRKGMVFKFARDGVATGEKWNVFVEDEEEGNRMRILSRFGTRPSMDEVEYVLYNLMAVNSPITKSAKFLRDLVSNVTGKKPN